MGTSIIQWFVYLFSGSLLTKFQSKDNVMNRTVQLTNLRKLNIHLTTVTPDGIRNLPNLVNLEDLTLISGAQLSDNDLTRVAKLTQLKRLSCKFAPNITDNGIKNLISLTNLRDLRVIYAIHLCFSGYFYS